MRYKVIPRHRVIVTIKEICIFFILLLRDQTIKGNYIQRFETEFAKYIGTNFSLAVSSGRIGLQIIFESLGFNNNDEIILPGYTFPAVPKMIEKIGLNPIFVDINENDYNMNTDLIEAKITTKTKAIIATHLFGTPCELNKILEIAKKYNLFIVEDCAQSIGAEYYGKRVGSFGNCAFFSFETVKPFHTFGGGMITTNDPFLYDKLKNRVEKIAYPNLYSINKKIIFSIIESIFTHPLFFTVLIYPFLLTMPFLRKNLKVFAKKTKSKFKLLKVKYTNFQAIIGSIKLKELNMQLNKRIINAKFLISQLNPDVQIQRFDPCKKKIFYYLSLKDITGYLSPKLFFEKGIDTDTNVAESCINPMNNSEYPVINKVTRNIIFIPVYPQLTNRDINHIAKTIRSGKETEK